MHKKILRIFFILFGLAALSASTSRTFMKYIIEKRDGDEWWDANNMKGGDLAAISGLTFLKKFRTPFVERIKRAVYNGTRDKVLYLVGDSYTWSLRDTNFAAISDFHFINRYDGGYYHLDNNKNNILIIAVTELWVRRYFRDTRMLREIYDSSETKNKTTSLSQDFNSKKGYCAGFFPELSFDMFFNKNINQNLQCNLFNYQFMVRAFQYKAAINLYLFNRGAGNAVLSRDKNFLFLKATVSATDTGSSYFPLNPGEIDRLIDNFNTIYQHYKAEGFKEVYLSVISSTASVMQPEGYNNLIPLIQKDARLKMKLIDVYYTFKNSPQLLFYHGDSHWNEQGKQLWVDKVNKILTNDYK